MAGARVSWWRWGAMAVVLVTAAATITWLLLPPPPPEVTAPPPPEIEVAGERLVLEGDPVADALDLVRRYARQPITLTFPEGSERTVVPASLGAEIDRVRLAEFVKSALDPTSAVRRAYTLRLAEDAEAVITVPVPIRIDTERSIDTLLAMKDDVDRPASDAVVDLQKKALIAEKLGLHLDVYGTIARLEEALRGGRSEVEAAVDVITPRVVASQLGHVEFDHVLGYFETRYSQSSRYKARTYNLRLAASRLDGTVLLPGEEFDFNGTVGPRDEANGYRVAPVIAQGELVDGIGGGTCQVSGTLHAAAFFAGLDIVERAPHSRPSSYILLGLDAAVAYPSINYRIRNNFDFPVVLHESVKKGVVRAEILGPERDRTVSLFRRIDEVIPFEVEERESDELPRGARALSQRGVPGFETTVYRITREGAYAVREKLHTKYPPTTQIVKVGTGPSKRDEEVKHDGAPEYRAAEYLVMVQGPDIRSPGAEKAEPGGGMMENRVPGKTGERGWQKEMGMPVFEEEKGDDEED